MEQPLREAGFEQLDFIEATLDEHTAALAEGAPVVCLFVNDDANAQAVAKLAKCGVKVIAMRCAGFDRVDLDACQEHGIKVVRVPTYSPTSVAEHAVGLMFAVNRKLHQAYTRVQAGNYSLTPLVGSELRGKTVGVLGTGAIGTEAARMFKGLGMEVLAYDVRQNPAVEALNIPYHDMDYILERADVISLHVPLLPSTYHLINKDRVAKMKKGCILLNVSRGGLVENAALVSGLESRQIGGLGMDVYENEGQ
jgi:D-lactate dehydrogenase